LFQSGTPRNSVQYESIVRSSSQEVEITNLEETFSQPIKSVDPFSKPIKSLDPFSKPIKSLEISDLKEPFSPTIKSVERKNFFQKKFQNFLSKNTQTGNLSSPPPPLIVNEIESISANSKFQYFLFVSNLEFLLLNTFKQLNLWYIFVL
jgi:hypothetical protein